MSEDKKLKPLTVEEVKALEPLADNYKFNTFDRYIISIKKSLLAGGDDLTKKRAQMVYQVFKQAGIPVVILVGADEWLTIFEVKP